MFIQPNKTKAKLKQGLPVYGVLSTSDDPQFAELCGIAGFDFYMLDAEHGLIDPAQAVNVIRACEQTDITPLIRIGSKDPKLVLQYLDAGMMGIMMPGLEVCIVGPRDLSLNMGFPDGPNHPEVQTVIDQVIAVMKQTNIIAGITAGTRADAAKQVARGANMIIAASQSLIFSGSKEFLPEK